MDIDLEIVRYTGKCYFKKRIFGGFDIFVEVVAVREDMQDFSKSPEFTTYIKANERMLNSRIGLVIKP